MKRRLKTLACLALCLTLLGGCTGSVPIKNSAGVTLPPVVSAFAAPVGDGSEEMTQRVSLFLPDAATGQLVQVQERLAMPTSRHPAETVLSRLFSYQSSGQVKALGSAGALQLMPGRRVEISGGTAVVNLAAGALSLPNRDFLQAAQAIANTLAQWGDIRHVNILVNDQHPGIDPAASIPLGSLPANQNPASAASLWEARSNQSASSLQAGFSLAAALYFPAAAGRGILAEGRTVNFADASLPAMATALVTALSSGAASLPGLPQPPDLTALMAGSPLVDELPGAQGQVIQLSFREEANEQLIAAGIPRSIMMASLCLTLCTFIPGLAGIRVRIGQELISAVVPAGVLEGAGQEIMFQNQVMRREDFRHFLLDYCTLYFANAAGTLTASRRAIPYYQTHNPRFVLNQLLQGPGNTDSAPSLSPVLPGGLKDADWLGIARQNDTMLVNLSRNAGGMIKPLGETQELLMVYGMVNTLSRLGGISKVQFFVDGSQEGLFAGAIDVAGSFLPNAGLIAQ